MADLTHTPRVRPRVVAEITSLSVRKVQEMAAEGRIPGAAKLGGLWTFDLEKLRAWIAQQELKTWRESRATPTSAATRTGGASRSPASSIDAAYAQLIQGKRRGGSRRGA